MSHEDDGATLGVLRQQLRGARRPPARAAEALDTGRPPAKPRRSRQPRPHLWAQAQTRPERRRQLGLAKSCIDQRLSRGREQMRRVERTAQWTREQARRGADESLQLVAGAVRSVEWGCILAAPPFAQRMPRNGCPKVPRRSAVTRQHDLHYGAESTRRPRCLRPSHPINTAGRKTTRASCMSWPASLPFGSPRGVQGKRNRWSENGAKNSMPKE